MSVKFTNNAVATLAAGITTSSTTIGVSPGAGVLFPSLAAGEWFPVTVLDNTGAFEVMRCTARAGDALTVTRAQESTAAKAFNAGARIELRMTAASLEAVKDEAIAGASIGFTPVQQGGGAGQNDTKIYIGWTGSALKAQAGAADYGTLWSSTNFNPSNYYLKTDFTPASYAPLSGATFTGAVSSMAYNASMTYGNTGAPLVVRNNGGTGDAGLAAVRFDAGSYSMKLGMTDGGIFGMGGASSLPWRWYTTADGQMVASANVWAYSDPRLKSDVRKIDGALGIIERLNGVRFTWNGKTKLIGRPGQRDIGVLADEVEAVLPELVSRSIPDEANDGERWRIVAYDKLVPVLIEAVKELAAEVRTMNRGL